MIKVAATRGARWIGCGGIYRDCRERQRRENDPALRDDDFCR